METISRDGIIAIAHSQDYAGTVARNITDDIILLSAIVADYQSYASALASKIDLLLHLKISGLKGKRIGIA